MSEFLFRVAERMLEEAGVKSCKETDSLNGYASLRRKQIRCCAPTSVNRLIILAHECGHIALDHASRRLGFHRREYEAERYAIHACLRHKVCVSPARLEKCQRYVSKMIRDDVQRCRLREIDEEAYCWVGTWIHEEIQAAVQSGRIRLIGPVASISEETLARGLFPATMPSQAAEPSRR